MSTLDELERSVERLNRAVERLRHRVDLKSDNPYVVSAWSADDVLTRIVPHDDLVEMANAFRLLLSERAELLATVGRMRGALEELIDHAEECMGRLDYHDAGMLGDEPIKEARAALTTGEDK